MEIGENKTTNLLLSYLGEEKRLDLDQFVAKATLEKGTHIGNGEMGKMLFDEDLTSFFSSLQEEDIMTLRSYTGYHFKEFNSYLRGILNYEQNGFLSEERIKRWSEEVERLSSLISQFPASTFSFYTYRGTTIDTFHKYQIDSIEDLKSIEGKYMYEKAFISTSLLEECCYFKKDLPDGKDYNIQIEYLIPRGSQDGALLANDDLSYSASQNEYLINKGSLSKVVEVDVDSKNNQAHLKAVLIPKTLWETYQKSSTDLKTESK